MLEQYFSLFFEFVKVGLFTFGGGYASLPFLYQMSEGYGWFSVDELTQMIAISGLTPGPIGLNMATFAGFKTAGLFGSIISSFALILPMIIIASQVFRLYKKFSENKFVKTILYVLRPTSCALICFVALKLFYGLVLNNDISFAHVNFRALALVLFLFVLTFKFSRNPLIYIAFCAVIGAASYFLK